MDRVLLSVKRFKQRKHECAVATTASLANFFDSDIDYDTVRALLSPKKKREVKKWGLSTSDQCSLLNELGFENVTIVTADLNLIDFSWEKYTKKSIIRRMKKLRAHYRRQEEINLAEYVHGMIIWLEDIRYDNNIIIDYDFKKYIKRQLNRGAPIGAAVNWTSLFKYTKGSRRQKDGDITGEGDDHAFIIRGYDAKGVFVVDSHTEYYRGKLAKYKRGFYKLSWQKFLVNIPGGDLVIL